MNFTRKTKTPPAPPWYATGWSQVLNAFPPGRAFSFITQTLVVSAYATDPNGTPEMIVKYLSADGRICRETFAVQEISLLLAIHAAQPAPAQPQPTR